MRIFNFAAVFLLCFLSNAVIGAQQIHPAKNGPVHEAFMTREVDVLILPSVPIQPPANLNENSPRQVDPQMIWIPGYWAWSGDYNDFIWVSGVWRKPPLGMEWVSGFWKSFEEGWVWLGGFWSPSAEGKLPHIPYMPPAALDEKVPLAPGEDYFWLPGYWAWQEMEKKYHWISGKWEKFDPNWVYVPSHYVWRPTGYLFIQSYWDWPLESRGTAYASVRIEMQPLSGVYTPHVVLEPLKIVEYCYPWWPEYSLFYHFHFYFHKSIWHTWDVAPPWWVWTDWWAFTLNDRWALWWWWTHPRYPHPSWLTQNLASKIAPPKEFVLKVMESIAAPPIVTVNGVISQQVLFDAIQKVTGMPDGPILSSDPREILDIQDVAKPPLGPMQAYLQPSGKRGEENPPPKPFFGPSLNSLRAPPDRIRIPAKPSTESPPSSPALPFQKHPPEHPSFPTIPTSSYLPQKKKIPTYKPPQEIPYLIQNQVDQNPQPVQTNSYAPSSTKQPTYLPQSISPFPMSSYPAFQPLSQPHPNLQPQMPPQPANMFYQPHLPQWQRMPIPQQYHYQGTKPLEKWPYQPLQLQNRKGYMQRPMPQHNAPGTESINSWNYPKYYY